MKLMQINPRAMVQSWDQTSCGELRFTLTRRCITWGSMPGSMSIAFLTALTISSGSGSASTIMSSGRTWKKKERMVCRKLKNHLTNVQIFIKRETDNQVQDLWDTSNSSAYCQQSTACCFQNGNAKCLCKWTKNKNRLCFSVTVVIHKMVTPLHLWHEKLTCLLSSFSVALRFNWQEGRICKKRRKKQLYFS